MRLGIEPVVWKCTMRADGKANRTSVWGSGPDGLETGKLAERRGGRLVGVVDAMMASAKESDLLLPDDHDRGVHLGTRHLRRLVLIKDWAEGPQARVTEGRDIPIIISSVWLPVVQQRRTQGRKESSRYK